MFKQVVKIIGVLSIVIYSAVAAINIGAFNSHMYGKTKASRPEVVSMFVRVSSYTVATLYVAIMV